ncbi:MAG: acyltransferase family protein [Novosphingobium sp.]
MGATLAHMGQAASTTEQRPSGALSPGLSLYLELLRLLAATEVVLFHINGFALLGGHRAAWNAFGHEAVVVFFVLSGFVIAFAAETREKTPKSYLTSRLTRIYSVAVPCLLATLLFDRIGQALQPQLYDGLITDGSALVRLVLGSLFLNESWTVSAQMFSNTPYWSISYASWSSIIFAGLFYFRGWARIALTALACLIAGYKILLLFPIWALGWGVYRWTRNHGVAPALGLILFLQPALVLYLVDSLELTRVAGQWLASVMGQDNWRIGLSWSRYVLTDTLLGLSMAAHFIGAAALGPWLERALQPIARTVKWLTARSFTLYLLHQPAMLLAGAMLITLGVPLLGSWSVFAATWGIVLAVAQVSELQKHRLKPLVRWMLDLPERVLARRRTAIPAE